MSAVAAIGIEGWLEIAVQACEETARGQLGCDFGVGGPVVESPVTDIGSYVALVGDETSAQIGLVASVEGCRTLARRMLALDDGEPLDDADMCDAMGEIANIIGGSTKRLISARIPGFQLGLPLFMQGRLLASDRQEVGMVQVRIGDVDAHLLVVRYKAA